MADGTLNYEFKVDVPTGPLEKGAHEVDKLTRSLEHLDHQGGKHAESVEHKIRHELGGVGHSVEYVKNEVHDLLEVFGLMIAFEIGEKFLESLKEIGEEALKAAAAGERMDLAFELTLGKEGGAEMIEFMERIGKHTEFTEFQLKGWGKQLLNAGVEAEELDKYMAAASDVAAKSPDKMEGMSKAIQALTRASLTGFVDTRQLRGLSIGVEQLKTLPKFANMTAVELRKQLTKGKLTKEELLEIIAGPDRVLGDMALRAGKTLDARLTHLKAIPEEIFAKLRHTEGFQHFSDAIGRLLEKLDPEGPLGKRIVDFAETITDKFATFLDDVDWDSALDTLKQGLNAIEYVVSLISKGLRAMGDTWAEFKEDLGRAPKGSFGKRLAKEKLEDDTGRGREMMRAAAKDDFDDLDKAAQSGALGAQSKAYYDAAHKHGEAAGDGLTAGMNKSHGKVKHGGRQLGHAAEEGTSDELDIQSPSRVFEDIGGLTAAGFAAGLAGGDDMVSGAVNQMLAIPRGTSGAGRGAGDVTVSIGQIQVHVSGHATEDDGAAAARGFAQELRPQLVDIFEQIQAEMGV